MSEPSKVHRRMLEALVCPLTQGRLEYDEATQELISRSASLAFPIRQGIPVMLVDEARKIARKRGKKLLDVLKEEAKEFFSTKPP